MNSAPDYSDTRSTSEDEEDFARFKQFSCRNVLGLCSTRNIFWLAGGVAEMPLTFFEEHSNIVMDIDLVIAHRDYIALPSGVELDFDPPFGDRCIVFDIQPNSDYPGYVHLVHRSTGQPIRRGEVTHVSCLGAVECDPIARMGVESDRPPFVANFVKYEYMKPLTDFMSFKQSLAPPFVDSLPPALKYMLNTAVAKFEGTESASAKRGKLADVYITGIDIVASVRCPVWPTEAAEWKTRARCQDWPSDSLVDQCIHSGCCFIAKVPAECPRNSAAYEFKYSFSLAEIILLRSWLPTQKYIYSTLKQTLKKIRYELPGHPKKSVRTYQLKTLMLWACENWEPICWREENVKRSMVQLLKDLVLRLTSCDMPQYFMRHIKLVKDFQSFSETSDLASCTINALNKEIQELSKSSSEFHFPPSSIGNIQVPRLTGCLLKMLCCNQASIEKFLMFNTLDLYRALSAQLKFETNPASREKGDLKRLANEYFEKALEKVSQDDENVIQLDWSGYCDLVSAGEQIKLWDESFEEELSQWKCITSCTTRQGEDPKQCTIPGLSSNYQHVDKGLCNVLALLNLSQSTRSFIDQCARRLFKCSNKGDSMLGVHFIPGSEEIEPNGIIHEAKDLYDLNVPLLYEILQPKNSAWLLVAAHRANYFWVTERDYKAANDTCDQVLERCHTELIWQDCYYYDMFYPVTVSRYWLKIFDNEIQSIFNKKYAEAADQSFPICPWFLIFYIKLGCTVKLGKVKNELAQIKDKYEKHREIKPHVDFFKCTELNEMLEEIIERKIQECLTSQNGEGYTELDLD